MKRLLSLLLWLLVPGLCCTVLLAATYPAPEEERQQLSILSNTNEQAMRPVLLDFQRIYPQLTIEYTDQNSLPLYNRFKADYASGVTDDVVISSAMDLQISLVNKGFADAHDTADYSWLPQWAQWRREAFGFTYEPAVLVYNSALLKPEQIPENRFQLLDLLNQQRDFFSGRIGTYDIANSGLGYLFASQDAEQASTWGRLVESMRRVDVQLYESTGAMLDAVRGGELLMAYNVLGSYAYAYAKQHPEVKMVLLSDYTLVMSRVAFVSRKARNKDFGHLFLAYLLSERGQQLLADEALYPIHPAISGEVSYAGLERALTGLGPFKAIKLGPALLTYQDKMKQARFLREWRVVLD